MSNKTAQAKMTGHGRVLCEKCKQIIITCKCRKCSENIMYDVCDACESKSETPADGEKTNKEINMQFNEDYLKTLIDISKRTKDNHYEWIHTTPTTYSTQICDTQMERSLRFTLQKVIGVIGSIFERRSDSKFIIIITKMKAQEEEQCIYHQEVLKGEDEKTYLVLENLEHAIHASIIGSLKHT